MNEHRDLILALGLAKRRLGDALTREAINTNILQAANHDHKCPVHKRAQWHVPLVTDTVSGEFRPAVESDCACWKSKLVPVPLIDPADVGDAAVRMQSYDAIITIPVVPHDQHELVNILCSESGFIPSTAHSPVDLLAHSNTYSDILFRTLKLIGELRLDGIAVSRYKIDGTIRDVQFN